MATREEIKAQKWDLHVNFVVTTLVPAVKKFALANYDRDGWDVIVETMEDEELAEMILESRCYTVNGAIKAVRSFGRMHDDRRQEVQSYAF